ncbi:Mu-like prophage major head subunit gpT family protein [Dactylosporangium salmoneum]|uniref:Bacteriophage Mu GpT domain-containing protein n=1 Tax=Dactylosporangium salmoneum TaxID=53361 RepID=A0ABN3G976_9ACTN
MTTNTLFSQAVDRMDAETASYAALFGGQQAVALQRPRLDPRLLVEAERFLDQIKSGRRPLHHFQEAMTTSDFPLYFADSLDRQMYGAYTATDPTWRNYARAATVNDFRTVKRFATSGIRGRLEKVQELEEHKRRAQNMGEYEYAVDKYEAGFGLSFEMMINDDLDAFMRLPQDLAQSAIDSEELFVTEMFCDGSGPHASFYTGPNDNVLAGNPALTRPSLQDAITKLTKRVDDNGMPIQIKAVELVVGPGLALAAEEIINATEYRAVGPNGAVTIIRGNGVSANLRVNVNYFIPAVAKTANADTSWWLFANPGDSRPALEFGRLRGYEAPALYEKLPDMRRIGGGEVPWSFNHSAAEKKVVHVFGGTRVDTRMTVSSNGSGS